MLRVYCILYILQSIVYSRRPAEEGDLPVGDEEGRAMLRLLEARVRRLYNIIYIIYI